jgi:hypothetical protein
MNPRFLLSHWGVGELPAVAIFREINPEHSTTQIKQLQRLPTCKNTRPGPPSWEQFPTLSFHALGPLQLVSAPVATKRQQRHANTRVSISVTSPFRLYSISSLSLRRMCMTLSGQSRHEQLGIDSNDTSIIYAISRARTAQPRDPHLIMDRSSFDTLNRGRFFLLL